jgi:hypothetical protein
VAAVPSGLGLTPLRLIIKNLCLYIIMNHMSMQYISIPIFMSHLPLLGCLVFNTYTVPTKRQLD